MLEELAQGIVARIAEMRQTQQPRVVVGKRHDITGCAI
jgi:hypothetical protein